MAQTLDEKGNVVVNGLSTNLSPSQYAVSLPQTIPTNNLSTPSSTPQITQPNYNTSLYQNTANSSQAYVSSSLADEQRKADQQVEAQRLSMENANTDLGRLSSSLQGKTSDTYNAYNLTGATDKLAILNKLNSESLGLGYARDTIPLQLQNQVAGQGVTDRGLAPIQTAQLRNNAIQLASNAYQSAIARNDYETAKIKADEIIANKYDGILADIEAKKTNIENIKYSLSSAEKRQAEATTRRLDAEKKAEEKKMANDKASTDMIINARGRGAPRDIVDKAQNILNNGGSPLDVAKTLGEHAGDYLKNELLRRQIDKTKAEANKISGGVSNGSKELVTKNGITLIKVTPKEIQDLNDTQIAKNSLVSLVDNMINSIEKYGTQVLFGEEAGTRSGAKTNLLLAMKNLEKTGALDKGTIDVLSGTIPDSEFFATESAQKAALQQLKDTIVNKTDEYINSYKGTTAETDPRTKRIYEKEGTNIVIPSGVGSVSASYAQSTMGALNNVNNQIGTQQSYSGYDTGVKN